MPFGASIYAASSLLPAFKQSVSSFFMRLLSDKHHLQCMRKINLKYFGITLLTYKTEKLLIMTCTLRYLESLKNLQYTVTCVLFVNTTKRLPLPFSVFILSSFGFDGQNLITVARPMMWLPVEQTFAILGAGAVLSSFHWILVCFCIICLALYCRCSSKW